MRKLNSIVAIIAFVIWASITLIPGIIKLNGKTQELGSQLTKAPDYSILAAALFTLVVVFLTGSGKQTGLTFSNFKNLKIFRLQSVIILICTLFLIYHYDVQNIYAMMWLFLNCIFVGISEELMFRGILLSGLTKDWGYKMAAITVIVVFGLVHVLNAFTTGKIGEGALQAFMTMCSGMLLLSYRVKSGTIILAMIFHAVWDFIAFMLSSTLKLINPELLTIVVGVIMISAPVLFGIYGFYLLTRKGAADDFIESQD